MTISYYSYIHSIIITTILMAFICFIRSRYRFTHTLEVRAFVLLYMICFIRMFFPFDFKITNEIPLQGIYATFFQVVIYNRLTVFNDPISVSSMIFFVVIGISFFNLLLYMIERRKTIRNLEHHKNYDSSQLERVHKDIRKIYQKLPECDILEVNYINLPLVVGVIRKRILLPSVKYSEIELYYILLHEYTHIMKHDLLKKLLVDISGCIFWWLPFIGFAKQDIDQLIEIKCDSSIVKRLSDSEKINYMGTLLEVVKRESVNHNMKLTGYLGFAFMENSHPIIERFKLMSSDCSVKRKKSNISILLFGLLFIVCSYLVAPVPDFEPNISDIQNSGFTYVTPENTYLVEENGEFLLVTNGNTKSKVSKEHAKYMIDTGIKIKGE